MPAKSPLREPHQVPRYQGKIAPRNAYHTHRDPHLNANESAWKPSALTSTARSSLVIEQLCDAADHLGGDLASDVSAVVVVTHENLD